MSMRKKLTLQQKKESYRLNQISSKLDISVRAIPLYRYCIASTPRSGSTLISRMLLSSNLAGDPKQYLNPLLMQAWQKINKKNLSFSDYIKELEAKRTTNNGFFGIKIHGRHLEELSKKISAKSVISFVESFDKFIFISRKDKINQAISYYIARSTGVFHFDQEDWIEEFKIPQPDFNPIKILNHLSFILKEEMLWESFFEKINKPVYRINHEDFVKEYAKKSKEIFDFLGIESSNIPAIPTKPMNKKFSSEYKNLLLEKIGLNDSNQIFPPP